ncbi:MAG: Group II intron-encoded protein LtrA [Spirochaetes bacterium ADurb.Bin110]|nr:MAG: Group II intron-encoded protein LtrA [Spirochaetes bacterium ADurb.Bin110]
MQESYGEGVANHPGSGSCTDTREGIGEALTRVHTGQPLSCERNTARMLTLLSEVEDNTMSCDKRECDIDSAQSETLSMCGNSLHVKREVSSMPTSQDRVDCYGKSSTHEPEIDVGEKSDGYIVPKKLANKAGCGALAAERVHEGRYRPQPARRVYIPKANVGTRPLGIVTLEDKIVQYYGIAQILLAIYEQDFLGFSYGFRPGKSQHDALDALHVALMHKVNWVLDADIKGFFDTINHEWMMRFVEHRVGDPRVLMLIYRWLKAGVVEDGRRFPAKEGTPKRAMISPLLANIYLHYVLDLWIQK